jgi:hypothetical protein
VNSALPEVASDAIVKVGLSESQRRRIRHGVTLRHNQKVRQQVCKVVAREIIELESRIALLRGWLHRNKGTGK